MIAQSHLQRVQMAPQNYANILPNNQQIVAVSPAPQSHQHQVRTQNICTSISGGFGIIPSQFNLLKIEKPRDALGRQVSLYKN